MNDDNDKQMKILKRTVPIMEITTHLSIKCLLDFFLQYFFIALISNEILKRSPLVIELTRYIQIASRECFYFYIFR